MCSVQLTPCVRCNSALNRVFLCVCCVSALVFFVVACCYVGVPARAMCDYSGATVCTRNAGVWWCGWRQRDGCADRTPIATACIIQYMGYVQSHSHRAAEYIQFAQKHARAIYIQLVTIEYMHILYVIYARKATRCMRWFRADRSLRPVQTTVKRGLSLPVDVTPRRRRRRCTHLTNARVYCVLLRVLSFARIYFCKFLCMLCVRVCVCV